GACAARVFYDLDTEKKRATSDIDREPLEAGIFQKPGKKLPSDMSDPAVRNVIDDLEFDGYAELCMVVTAGAYNYSQKCWLFNRAARTFVRNEDLDPLIFVSIDRRNKKLTSSFRAGGPIYSKNEYVWQQGNLVQMLEETTVVGQKLDGSPLP